jgi:hypothetical protein
LVRRRLLVLLVLLSDFFIYVAAILLRAAHEIFAEVKSGTNLTFFSGVFAAAVAAAAVPRASSVCFGRAQVVELIKHTLRLQTPPVYNSA